GKIADRGMGGSAEFGNVCAGRFEGFGTARANRHAGTGLGKGQRNRASYPAAASGDDGALAGDVGLHAFLLDLVRRSMREDAGQQKCLRMIKSIGLLTRKASLSHQEFVKHWLEVHAPLAHAVPGVRRYVQSHIVDERTRPDIATTDV